MSVVSVNLEMTVVEKHTISTFVDQKLCSKFRARSIDSIPE